MSLITAAAVVPFTRSNSWQFSDTSLALLSDNLFTMDDVDCSSSSSSSSSACSSQQPEQSGTATPTTTTTTTTTTLTDSLLVLPSALPCLTPNGVSADLGGMTAAGSGGDWEKMQMFPLTAPLGLELQQQQQQQVLEIQQSLQARRSALNTTAAGVFPQLFQQQLHQHQQQLEHQRQLLQAQLQLLQARQSGSSATASASATVPTTLAAVPSSNAYHARVRAHRLAATQAARKRYINGNEEGGEDEQDNNDEDEDFFLSSNDDDAGNAGNYGNNDDNNDAGADDARVPASQQQRGNDVDNDVDVDNDDDEYKPSRKGKCKPCNWSEDLLKMGTRDLNRYLKSVLLSKAEVADLKAARRRAKNRVYARLSRQRRLKKFDSLTNEYTKIQDNKQHISAQLQRLRQEVHQGASELSELEQLMQL